MPSLRRARVVATSAWIRSANRCRSPTSSQKIRTVCHHRTRPWGPIGPADPARWAHQPVVFVDGTRRIDARLYISNGEPQAIPGLAASIGVGAVVCDRRARIAETRIDRFLTVGSGTRAGLAVDPSLNYKSLPSPAKNLDGLVDEVHNRMRTGEAALAQDLAKSHPLVFLDGPLAVMRADPQPIVGFIKSHHRHYLEPEEEEILPRLGCGQRTPLFAFGEPRPATPGTCALPPAYRWLPFQNHSSA